MGWRTVLGLDDLGWNFSLVLTVDATPDTRELECNEIKTQVELATGRLGLRRAAQEHTFPQMLHQVGLSTSNQPGHRTFEVARALPALEKREINLLRNPEVLELETS